MTIFLQVTKHFIIQAIDAQISLLLTKDARADNFLFKNSRDLTLSAAKRSQFETLKKSVHETASAASDLDTAKQLIHQLRTSLIAMQSTSQSFNHLTGTSEETLTSMIDFVISFYKKSKQLKLIDQPLPIVETDYFAFILLLRACAFYSARRIFDEPKAQTLQSWLHNPNLTPINSFHTELDNKINKKLFLLWSMVEKLAPDDPTTLSIKNNAAEEAMEDLLTYHQITHQKYAMSLGKLLKPLPTYLEDYLNEAYRIMQGLEQHSNYMFLIENDEPFDELADEKTEPFSVIAITEEATAAKPPSPTPTGKKSSKEKKDATTSNHK